MKYVIRPLFSKYQRELIAFANTNYGKDFLSQFGGKELKENYPVVRVTPDGIHQWLGKNLYRGVFYPRSPYVKLLAEVLTLIDIASDNYKVDRKEQHLIVPHFLGETKLLKHKLPIIYLDQNTYYPDANPESTSVDGYADFTAVDATWGAMCDGAGTDGGDTDTAVIFPYYIRAGSATSRWDKIGRAFFLFDTSALSGATVSAATFSLYSNGVGASNLSVHYSLVKSNPASNTAIVTGDYDAFTIVGDTIQSNTEIAIASMTSGYKDYALNSSGVSTVQDATSGITKFGIRLKQDVDRLAPSWGADLTSYFTGVFADNGSNKPKLVVTYTLPSGINTYKTLLGVGL